ncbi:MAG: glutamate-5-semialdehyde dehydrogenase [Armatimonadetes bacterium]|nr:glutamate-5-semialdehyde dehydrogenase [Armatimonadota bacterium]MDW8154171.1 glutamate-5-semialdehyde dehydrogenase [Armatimonadota bacterium]
MIELASELRQMGERARAAAQQLLRASPGAKQRALMRTAELLEARWPEVLEANRKDLEAARGLPKPKLERLRLGDRRRDDLAEGLRQIASLPDPVGEIEQITVRPNGLLVGRMRVPLGVIGLIYEARPDATVEASAVALKAGNAILLRGGKEARYSNEALVRLIRQALEESGLPPDAVQLLPAGDRQSVLEMCRMEGVLDLLIPRGGEELIRFVQEHARVPVLAHAKGVNHLYVDEEADLEMAVRIAVNAKAQRPATCNALEKVLVHQTVAAAFLPRLAVAMREAGVELRGCPRTQRILPHAIPAREEDWSTEYLDLVLAVRVVDSFEEALAHIARYGSRHTEAIVTRNHDRALRFLREVDASLVLVNASTRFNDGFQLGLGAEIGISTTKLHAYGPMGVRELTTTKFVALGQGQVRT